MNSYNLPSTQCPSYERCPEIGIDFTAPKTDTVGVCRFIQQRATLHSVVRFIKNVVASRCNWERARIEKAREVFVGEARGTDRKRN